MALDDCRGFKGVELGKRTTPRQPLKIRRPVVAEIISRDLCKPRRTYNRAGAAVRSATSE